MNSFLRKYWAELLVFGAILGALLICTAPNYTWINTDCDGIHYTYAAKYLYPAHKTSAPLFLLLGRLFLWLPFGTEAWRMVLVSVLASMGSVTFIYLVIREKVEENGRLLGIIGALVFGGSALVISQSTIIETYALVTMFGLGAYYFAIKKNWLWCAIMLGAGGAIHHLVAFPTIVFLIAFKDFRKRKYIGIMASFLLFYLYIPITVAINNPPNMWGNATLQTFWGDTSSTVLMLFGGLSIWDLPKRILDAIGILGASLGLAIIPIIWLLKTRHANPNPGKEPLLWLFILPIIYYTTNLAPQTYVYVMPAIGFGAVITGIALSKMRPYWKYIVLSCAIGLLAFNANYFDIGRTLDPELSASKYYYEELNKVPDGEILLPQYGWEWAAIFSYNKNNDRNIIPVCADILPSLQYRNDISELGIGLSDYPDEPLSSRAGLIANSIVELNDNVWTTRVTDPKTYGGEIILAEKGTEVFNTIPIEVEPEWQWKPNNPYDIITGAIEVEEWTWIIFSNYSCLMFGMLAGIGGTVSWVGYMTFVRKKKWHLKKNKKTEMVKVK